MRRNERLRERRAIDHAWRDLQNSNASARHVARRTAKVARLYEREGGICHLCDQLVDRENAEIDHVVPVANGGGHEENNLALAHRFCNRHRRHASVADARASLKLLAKEEDR